MFLAIADLTQETRKTADSIKWLLFFSLNSESLRYALEFPSL